MATDIRIDTGPLAGAFRDMTASYKAFWFLALVDAAASRQLGATRERLVPFEEMRERMLQAAFWPAVRYRLSFGKSDRLYLRLAGLRDDDGNESLPPLKAERDRGILRHVPQRFLVPWIETKLVGVPQSRIDTAIRAVVETEFRTLGAVPYRILQDGIELDPAWHEFLVENYGVMRALGERELIRFLQARNPTIPGIPDKIAEARRGSLSEQTRFWRDAAEKKDMRCIYSGEPVLDDFSLDHFVPWSFVVHDRIWNLVPARKSINSRKGLRLPSDELVEKLCGMHLVAVRHAMDDTSFIKTAIAESYEIDLRIDLREASDDEFLAAQREAIIPLVMQARRSGFPSGWSGLTETMSMLQRHI